MKCTNFTKNSKLPIIIILERLRWRKQYETGESIMKKKIGFLLVVAIISTLVACGKEEEPATEFELPEPLTANLTVTEEVEVGGQVDMKTVVTIGDKKIEEASEVVYEVWEEGKKTESEMIESVNEGAGVYRAETSFEHDGLFHIQVHVTAEAQHTMPVKTVTVGDGGHYEEDAGHDYHTEGFSMHFMKPSEVKPADETELVVHIELAEEPLEELNVRYEIWHEDNPEKHDWVNAKETKAGEYTAVYEFSEEGSYTTVIHVEDDKDLHEHEEHTIKVK